jgi:hypothetical protein
MKINIRSQKIQGNILVNWDCISFLRKSLFQLVNSNNTNSVAFSPQVNYTDWATATFGEI